MRKRLWTILALVFIVPGLMMLAGCPKPVDPEDPTGDQGTTDDTYGAQPSPTPGYGDDSAPTPTPPPDDPDQPPVGGLYPDPRNDPDGGYDFENKDIYFEFDSSALSATAQGILKDKANFMNKYKSMSIVIEGHCDERGTNEYNLALGDRRAESAKSFLLKLGISASKIKTISYGEEKPVDMGHDEAAWEKNRRAHFVIQ